jgi:hypothetical protein
MGADGVNPIEFLVLVVEADRQWLEAHYFDTSINPIGKIRIAIPAGPNEPDALMDSCIAFCPRYFKGCPALTEVEALLRDVERLDFQDIPPGWSRLREQARPTFAAM